MSTKIKIQIFSDIHIELWDKLPEIPVKSKFLFLAGDICKLNHILFFKFLDFCSMNWEKTFYVPGNHEFYSNTKNYNELNFEYRLKIKERYKNVFYLNDDHIALNDTINVYGTIFWTIPPFTTTIEAKTCIKDYNHIKYFNKNQNKCVNWDISYVKELSDAAFNKLQDYLNTTDKKTIIITHFPPFEIGSINPMYLEEKSIPPSYFSWNDDTLNKLRLKNVLAWISGHTHWSYDLNKNGIRLISNQIGYKNEICKTRTSEEGLYKINLLLNI